MDIPAVETKTATIPLSLIQYLPSNTQRHPKPKAALKPTDARRQHIFQHGLPLLFYQLFLSHNRNRSVKHMFKLNARKTHLTSTPSSLRNSQHLEAIRTAHTIPHSSRTHPRLAIQHPRLYQRLIRARSLLPSTHKLCRRCRSRSTQLQLQPSGEYRSQRFARRTGRER